MERNGRVVSYRFTTLGWYNVTLVVTDAAGNEDGALFLVEVTPPHEPDGNGGGDVEGYTLYLVIAIVAAIVVVAVYLKKGR